MFTHLHDVLEKYLISTERIEHSLRVAELSIELAKLHNIEQSKAYSAGLLHDIAKDITYEKSIQISRTYNFSLTESELLNKKLLHAPIGSLIVKHELGITDDEIINAIRCHTTGRANMSLLEKIIYISDIAEPGRKYPESQEIKELSFKDINQAMLLAVKFSLKKLMESDRNIDPKSIECYNYFSSLIKN